jgi:hypothetical protein
MTALRMCESGGNGGNGRRGERRGKDGAGKGVGGGINQGRAGCAGAETIFTNQSVHNTIYIFSSFGVDLRVRVGLVVIC